MSTNTYIKFPKLCLRAHEGPLGAYIDLYAIRLLEQGYVFVLLLTMHQSRVLGLLNFCVLRCVRFCTTCNTVARRRLIWLPTK